MDPIIENTLPLKTAHDLPTFEASKEAVKEGRARALQEFVYHNEPAGNEESDKFRFQLIRLINETILQRDREHARKKDGQ